MELRVRVPRSWREELQSAAHSQAISTADLHRLVLRRFLRGRYAQADQQALQERA